MAINGVIRDVNSATRVIRRRERKHNNASSEPVYEDFIANVSKKLHPGKIEIKLVDIKKYDKYAILKFEGEKIPYFKSGQYLTLDFKYHDHYINRPFIIISSPKDALCDNPTVEISVSNEFSETSKYLIENAKINDVFISEIALGNFTYDVIRDSNKIIFISENNIFSPVNSFIKGIIDKIYDIELIVVKDNDNIPYVKYDNTIEFSDLDKFYSNDYSYFICGSSKYVSDLESKLLKNGIKERRIRKEKYDSLIDEEILNNNEEFEIEVIRGINSTFIKAKSSNSIATALENNDIKIHTCCRNGVCGNCRIKIIDGKYYVPKDNENRRKTDIESGYAYACHTYPLSNMKIKISIN